MNSSLFRRLPRAVLAVLSLALALCVPLRADVVVLKSGWKTEGTVTETEDQVTVELKSGQKVTYPRADVVQIVRKETPHDAFEEKYKAVDRKDLKALQALASWCRLQGLGADAVRVAQDMLAVDPSNAFAKDILIRYKMVVEHIPPNPEREQQLLREFGGRFRIYRSRHYRIAYNTDQDYAQERGRCFEALYEQFYRHFDKMGLPMKFLQDHVEVVLFRSREEYAGFAASKFPALARSAGFYSQEDNRTYFFDGKGEAFYRAFQKQYSAYMQSLRNLRNGLAGVGSRDEIILTYADGRKETFNRASLTKKISEMERVASGQWREFQKDRQDANLSTTMHEGAHQVSFALGVLPTQGTVPRCIAEGIAMFFEDTEPDRKAEVSGMNPRWLKVYRAGHGRGLRTVLTDDAVWANFDDATEAAYGQGWALFYYLSTDRQAQLVKYLKTLRENAAKPDTPQRRIAEFEQAFGPINDVEKAWRGYMSRVSAK